MTRKRLLQTASPERYTESVPGGQRKERKGETTMLAIFGTILKVTSKVLIALAAA